MVTGTFQPVTQVMPEGMDVLTWAFATGECGSEMWNQVTPAQIAKNVPLFVAAGKKYILSTGGANGAFTCGSDAGFNKFVQTYNSPNLVGIDFDIEAGQTQDQIDAIMERVKVALVTYPHLRFSFTIATIGGSPTGNQLGATGTNVLNSIKKAGLINSVVVNLMAMDYGEGAGVCAIGPNGKCDMGKSAINAAESLHSFWSVPYSKIEITPMIGGNDVLSNIFTITDAATVSAYALEKGIAGIQYWSLDRDVDCDAGPASATCNSLGNAGTLGFAEAFIAGLDKL